MKLIRDTADLSAFMGDSTSEHRVQPASDWTNDVIDHFWKPDDSPKVRMPWLKTHKDFHFRPSEVTLWAGINGHGKSQLVGQVVHGLCEQNQLVALASLEMPPSKTMARMSRQAFGGEQPTPEYIRKYGVWTNGRLWLYDHVGSVNPATMLAVVRYSIAKFGIEHFIVDNLMKCGMAEDAYSEQKSFVDSLCVIAKDTGCHIHLVLHVKKGKSENDLPNKFDVKGSGAITDLVDNCFIVWRNKEKESKLRSNEEFSPDDPDCLLMLVKQRHGETEGAYRLYFDRQSLQYTEDRLALPTHCRADVGVSAHEVTF
jgi:twinkle protein